MQETVLSHLKLNRKRFELSGVRVIEGTISKKITWRGIEKGSS